MPAVSDSQRIEALEGRLRVLEAAEQRRAFRPWFTNQAFEDAFRGSAEGLRARYADLAREFLGCDPVLDLGCGRGEFLELLGEAHVIAQGVEMDGALVADAQARGLKVVQGDGLEALSDYGDGALGGLVLIQVIEHLTAQQLIDLVALAVAKLRPGGIFIAETVNPMCLSVFAHALYLDPTHDRPVHPAYLHFLAQQAGFSTARIVGRSVIPSTDVLQPVGHAVLDANAQLVNNLLFGAQDYALIAVR